jgi:hypothetical protein
VSARGFAFLLVVTVLAVMLTATIAEQMTEPGLWRTVIVALGTGLIIFPAARWAESRGWIKGKVQLGRIKDELIRKPK